MLIIGAKGFAKETLEVLYQNNEAENIYFFDDISEDISKKLFEKYEVVRSLEAVKNIFGADSRFCLGVGGPFIRYQFARKFTLLGGILTSVVSPWAHIGHYGSMTGAGCNIMTGVVITNDVKIEKGVLINLNCTVGHDSIIEEFVEMSPGSHISGNCKIGRLSSLGTNATILPGISIGENVIVGAGAVVTKDVPSNSLVIGIPAVIKEQLPPLKYHDI